MNVERLAELQWESDPAPPPPAQEPPNRPRSVPAQRSHSPPTPSVRPDPPSSLRWPLGPTAASLFCLEQSSSARPVRTLWPQPPSPTLQPPVPDYYSRAQPISRTHVLDLRAVSVLRSRNPMPYRAPPKLHPDDPSCARAHGSSTTASRTYRTTRNFEPEIPEIATPPASLSQSEFLSSSHSARHRLASGAGVARRTAVSGPEHARRPPRTGSALAPPSRPDLPS